MMKFEARSRQLSKIFKAAVVVLGVMFLPHIMPNEYWLRIYTVTGIWVMLSLGLNVVAGFAGLFDLAYVAFFGIGGYIFALLSSDHLGFHLPFLLVLPIAAILTMGIGFALGSTSLRLKGDYLAIVTLAFAFIFKQLLLNLDNPINITGGVNGIFGFDPISLFGLRITSPIGYANLIWISALLVVVATHRLKQSRYGRGWEALREDELAAEALGVNTTKLKLLAFATGAFIAGATGVLFASLQDSVFPNNFDFPQLVIVYCMVILGGLGNIPGVILGAIILSILPEFLREYGAYRMMSYGLILIVLMALRPQGIMSTIKIFSKEEKRPDRDKSGRLKASTDLYYQKEDETPLAKRTDQIFSKTDRVLLELAGITQDFGGLRAVDNVSFQVHDKEIVSIIGPNGAGKTTLFNIISGIYQPTQGSVIFEGEEVTGLKPHMIVEKGIARTFQNLRLFNKMTVLDNAKVARFCRTSTGPFSILLHLPKHIKEENATEEKAKELLGLFGARLTGYRFNQQAMFLSYANRRRLEIARALATDARLLLLDEPSAGMNPQETKEITEFIKSLRDSMGYTILLIEHKLNVVRKISDRVIALDYGTIIAQGTYEEVSSNKRVIEAYLGRKLDERKRANT